MSTHIPVVDGAATMGPEVAQTGEESTEHPGKEARSGEAMPTNHVPSFLSRENLRLIIFGGKGGVGKTTASAATAMYLARRHPDKRIVVASSDPAHSLADSFDCPVNGSVTQVKGIANLWAIELDSASLLEKFQKKHRFSIETLKKMSYSADQADLRDFLSFTLPGMEDIALLLEIGKLLKGGYAFDFVVLDTAPTGHTLRLLALPKQVLKWIDLFRASVAGFRWFSGALASQGLFTARTGVIPSSPRGNVREFVETLSKDLGKIDSILKNPEACDFVLVTIPEEMSIAESERLLATVKTEGIAVRNVVVNRVQEDSLCAFCSSRRKEQEGYLREIQEKFSECNIITMPVLPHEVHGNEALSNYAERFVRRKRQDLLGPAAPHKIKVAPHKIKTESFTPGQVEMLAQETLAQRLMLAQDLESVVFCGKGGVGKTTCSAATALSIAEGNPDRKILIVSLDPAHSLEDSFACPVGDAVTRVASGGQLYASEIDGVELYEDLKREYKENMEGAFQKMKSSGRYAWGREAKLNVDHELMLGFVDVYPPGVEDALALERIAGLLEGGEYDACIIDTAPTGHLVKLLKTPTLVVDWLKSASKAMMKYQREKPLDNLEKLNEKIFDTFRAVRKMQAILTDPRKGAFVAVTIPEAMGVLETEDLLLDIRGLAMPADNVVVNMVVPSTNCDFCATKRTEQLDYIHEMTRKREVFGDSIATVPLFPHEIRGVERLREISNILFEDGAGVREASQAEGEGAWRPAASSAGSSWGG